MTLTGVEPGPQPLRVSRVRNGRVLGGVCAGLSNIRGLGTNGLRVVFVLAAFCGGIGIVAYLACWLVIPETDEEANPETVRGVVLLAWASGGLVTFVLIAALSATATVFGFGWVVAGIAAVVLLVTLNPFWKRVPGVVALLAVAALTLPAVAVALSPVRIDPQDGMSVSRPATGAAVEQTVFRSGFGTQLIDLRHTTLLRSGTVTMRIDAGLRRTIVALPTDTCVHVNVNYSIHPLATQLATLVSGHQEPPFDGVVLFGAVYGATPEDLSGAVSSQAEHSGTTLTIDYTSQGGSLYVRDYPDDVSPDAHPNWPGFAVTPERRPDLGGESKKVAKMMLLDWHQRLRTEIANEQLINQLMPGPCES